MQKLLFIGLLLICGLAAPLVPRLAAQEVGDARRGRAFALETCTPCHVVAPRQRAPGRFAVAPSFDAIAGMTSTTPISLRVFLTSPHPTMPNLMLSPRETADVIAYILSLRR